MKYWAGLQNAGDGEQLREGAMIMQKEALAHHPGQAKVDVARIQGPEDARRG